MWNEFKTDKTRLEMKILELIKEFEKKYDVVFEGSIHIVHTVLESTKYNRRKVEAVDVYTEIKI